MSYAIQHDQDENLIIATVQGEFDKHGMQQLITELCPLIQQTACHCIITDMRQAHFNFSPADVLAMYDFFGEIAAIAKPAGINPHLIRRAFIANCQNLELYRLIETIARNRGHSTVMCQDLAQAKACLQKN